MNEEMQNESLPTDHHVVLEKGNLVIEAINNPETKYYLRNYLLQRAVSENDVDDVIQETFMKAFDGKDSFKGESSAKTWLCRIASKIVVDRYRHDNAKRRGGNSIHISFSNDIATKSTTEYITPNASAISTENTEEIIKLIGELPVKFQEILFLAFADKSYKEMADELSIPIGTVMSRLNTARKALRERLPEHLAELVPKNLKK